MKSKPIKVSVILPVYNVAPYLKECMDSLVNQTLKEIEIICVNDGSTDNSLEILNKYAEKDKRIIILEQENQGAGAARNAGLDIAKGEYLSFLDPDDFFELTLFEDCYNKATQTDVDIVVYYSNSYDDKKNCFSNKVASMDNGIRSENLPDIEVFSYTDMPNEIYDTFQNVPWNKFFKSSFINENNIRFQHLFRSNDVYFALISLATAKKITVLNKVLAYYRTGMKTNSQATTHMHPLDFYEAYHKTMSKLKDLCLYEQVESSFVITAISNSIYNLNSQKTYTGFKTVYECILTNLEIDFNVSNFEDLLYEQRKHITPKYETYKLMLEYSVDEYLQLKEKYFIDENDTSLKISVIIPVYNVENYLRDCLDSVVNQTLENIEIICINDGSTDNSLNILREYAKKDSRFVMLNQQNQGQSVARNKGISISKGKYIYFLDSDDMIVPYALERMYEETVSNNLDVLYFDGKSFFESKKLEQEYSYYKTSYKTKFSTNLVLSGAKMFAKMRSSNSYRVQCCLYFMKTEFVQREGIIFPEGIIHQDNVYMFKTILVADRVKHIKEELFIRRVRAGSTITQGITFNHFYGYLVCYMEMLDYSNKFEYTDDVEIAVVMTLNGIVHGAVKEYSVLSQSEKDKISKLTRLERHYFDCMIYPKVLASSNQGDVKNLQDSLNWNRQQLALAKKTNSGSVSNGYVNKTNGQLRWARGELAKVRKDRLELKKELAKTKAIKSSLSYKLGRAITWLPRKLRDIFTS